MSDMDTPENRVKLPADFAASVRTLGRRATFMAAFTYYQIGRYMYAGNIVEINNTQVAGMKC